MSDDDLGLDDMLSRMSEGDSEELWDASQGLNDDLDLTLDPNLGDTAGLGDSLDPGDEFFLSGPGEVAESGGDEQDEDLLLSSRFNPLPPETDDTDDFAPVDTDDFAPVDPPDTPITSEDPLVDPDVAGTDVSPPDTLRETLTDEDFGALSEMVAMGSTSDDYPAVDLKEVPPLDSHTDDVDPDEMSAFIENEIISIRMASERQARADDSDNVLAKQISTNARGRSIQNLPTGISMIELNEEKPDPQVVRAGDEKRLKWMAIAAMCIVFSVVASVSVALMVRPEIPTPNIAYGQGQNVGGGSVIDRNAAPAGAPGENPTGGSSSTGSEPVIPDGGSRVTYKVKAEGDITSASATYVDASGLPVQETGISLPWEITVGARASVTPNFAVAARGFGTLTCEVTSDGETIAEKTSTGESPTVNCTG